jgi:hypothetical protein
MLVCLHHHDVVMKDVHHDVVRSAITVATLACTVSMLRSHGIACTPSSHDVAHSVERINRLIVPGYAADVICHMKEEMAPTCIALLGPTATSE